MRPDAEAVFKGLRNAFRQFFRAGHHETQAAKIFRRAAARVSIQESRCGEQHGYRIFADQRADHARIERIRVKHDTDTGRRGQTERAGKAKGVEKRKNSQDAVVGVQHENLIELLDIRCNVVMREDHAFGISG